MATQTVQSDLDPDSTPSNASQASHGGSNEIQNRRVTCIFHCDCGRHFSSLDAFDRHRPGRTGYRKCVDPATVHDDQGEQRLAEKGTDAICCLTQFDKGTGKAIEVHGVTVWQTIEAAQAEWDRPDA